MKERIIITILTIAMFSFFVITAMNHFDKPIDVTCESHYENIDADATECY